MSKSIQIAMSNPIQSHFNHMSNQVWTQTSNHFIPPDILHSISPQFPITSDSEFRRKSNGTKYSSKHMIQDHKGNNKTTQLIDRRGTKKLIKRAKIERRVNPILLPIRAIIILIRILTLPLRILLAPLIILLRAIVALLRAIIVNLLRLLLFFINPFFFIFVAFQIFNIARIIGLILRIIFIRIFRRRKHEKREERDVKVITLNEEEEHITHHPWPIPIKKPPSKHRKKRRNDLNKVTTDMSTMSQLFPEEGIAFEKSLGDYLLQPNHGLFATNRPLNPAYYSPQNIFNQQIFRANDLLAS